MLERLGEVDWARLRHAFGPATDVPGLLRDLVSGDPARRGLASDALFGNIVHQGTVYSATPATVPFLVEIAGSTVPHARGDALALLGELAAAPDQASDEEDAAWAAASYRAVGGELPRILALLEDPEPPVRFGAALVVSRFRDRAGELAPILQAAARREQGVWRAGMVALVGKLQHVGSVGYLRDEAQSRDPAIRLAAQLALAWTLGPEAPPAAVAAVRRLEEDQASLERHLDGLPWDLYAELELEALAERLDGAEE